MNELKIRLNPKIIKRFNKYIQSDSYNQKNDIAEHWDKREKSNVEAFKIDSNNIYVSLIDSGLTDHYPQHFGNRSTKRGLVKFVLKSILNKVGINSSPAYNPKYYFNNFWPKGKGILSLNDIYEEYGKIDDYSIYKGCYYFNEISDIAESNNIDYKTVLEIGPGSGNLMRLIKKHKAESKIIIVDLPTSIPYSFLHLIHRFPDSKFLLPNETVSSNDINNYDFIFLTNEQTKIIPENFIDLAVNTMSFQEMRIVDIQNYFKLLRRILKQENLFYCVNAVEKVMKFNGRDMPIRFFDFPWSKNDHDYKYVLSNVEIGRTYKPFFVKAAKLNKDIK